MRLINQFSHLVLDMGGVFMFQMDRFAPEDRMIDTYQQLGGKLMDEQAFNQLMHHLINFMSQRYQDPEFYDSFPSLDQALDEKSVAPTLSRKEKELIIKVFTHHELGTISTNSIEVLHQLAKTHSLALISNIWAPSDLFKDALKKAGIDHLFDPLIISSDTRSIKPSAHLFEIPLKHWNIDSQKVAFIGDSLIQDIQGAQKVGMKTIWINKTKRVNPSTIQPDWEIRELGDLLV